MSAPLSPPGRQLAVGWRLAEEIAWARPERPGPEWWTLMDIAQDARDETRQGKPGHEYLMARGKCSRATVNRRIKALADAGLLTIAHHAAPGMRTVYEIPVIHELPGTCLSVSETRPGVTDWLTCLNGSETRSGPSAHADVSQNRTQRVSALVRHPPSLTPVKELNPHP